MLDITRDGYFDPLESWDALVSWWKNTQLPKLLKEINKSLKEPMVILNDKGVVVHKEKGFDHLGAEYARGIILSFVYYNQLVFGEHLDRFLEEVLSTQVGKKLP